MASNIMGNLPRITPYLFYEDVAGALDWLTRVFGFREREKETVRDPEGTILHTAIELGNGVVMMGCPSPDYRNPKRIGQVTQNLYVYVDDVKKHFEHAQRAGATILTKVEDIFCGDHRYGVEDLERPQWYFAQKARPISPEDWRPSAGDLEGHR